jgi:hypothetical protein
VTLPCDGKTRYSSGAAARRALDTMRTRRGRSETGKPLRAYACSHCHGHHLTSQDYQPGTGKKERGLWE